MSTLALTLVLAMMAGGLGLAEGILTETGTYPITTEPVVLEMFVSQAVNIIDYETNDFTHYLEDMMGIDLKFVSAPADSAKEKMNLLLTSGTYPAVFHRTIPDNMEKFAVQEGIFIDLTDLIDEHMPNLKAQFEANPSYYDMSKASDGKIYALPYVNECYHCTYPWKMWMNTMWLEEMGLDMPTTTEEFYEVCKTYLETNPNGIALGGAETLANGDPAVFLTNAFTYHSGHTLGLRHQAGTLDSVFVDPGYREALAFMNRLYSEGLLYESIYTMTRDQAKALAASEGEPILFVAALFSGGFADSIGNNEMYRHYSPLEPLKGPDGTQNVTYTPVKISGQFAITDKCEYPEVALRFADYFYTLDGYEDGEYGPDGWHRQEDGSSTLGLNGKPALFEITGQWNTVDPQNKTWQNSSLIWGLSDWRLGVSAADDLDIFTPEGQEKMLYLATENHYAPYHDDTFQSLPQVVLLTEESQKIQTISVEVETYAKQAKVDFITGAKDPNNDSDWEEYVRYMENIGLNTLVDVYQGAYDRSYK